MVDSAQPSVAFPGLSLGVDGEHDRLEVPEVLENQAAPIRCDELRPNMRKSPDV